MSGKTSWKVRGLDYVQGYWLKNFKNIHDSLLTELQQCLETGNIPDWLIKGRMVLAQKDKAKGNVAGNYRPINCLPLVWKLLTVIIADEMYSILETEIGLPEEQIGCRKNSRGTNDLLVHPSPGIQ